MIENELPTTMSFNTGMHWHPFLLFVGTVETGAQLEPNPLLCKGSVPTYEWVPGAHNFTGHFRAIPRSGGTEAIDG